MDKSGIEWDLSLREDVLTLFHSFQKNEPARQYLSRENVQEIADTLKLSVSEVDGVLSFYSMYSQHPRGKNIIRLCDSLSCRISASLKIYEHICQSLGIRKGETTEDGLFTLEIVNCLGNCDTAPNMMVNDTLYTDLTVSRVDDILNSCRQEARL